MQLWPELGPVQNFFSAPEAGTQLSPEQFIQPNTLQSDMSGVQMPSQTIQLALEKVVQSSPPKHLSISA